MVTIGRYASAVEAALPAAELAGEGIEHQVLNSNVNGLGIPYSGFSDVEIQVHEKDVERATEALDRINADDLEPAEDPAHAPPLFDDAGQPLLVAPVGAFDNVRALRDAQTVLASARIRSFSPALIRRGSAPPGTGKRFILRVLKEDFDRAESLLEESAAESGEGGEPRCPKCGAWRVYPVSHFWQGLVAGLGLAQRTEEQMECLACRYRGTKAQFEGRQG